MAAISSAVTISAAILFLLTAGMGVAVAYDRQTALMRFVLFVFPYLALLVATGLGGRGDGQWLSGALSTGSALLGALLSVYFLLGYEWSQSSGTYQSLYQIGQQITAMRPAVTLPETVNENVIGSALVILILTGLGGLLWSLRRRRLWAKVSLILLITPALLLSTFTLGMTESRGAWASGLIGLIAFVFVLWLTGAKLNAGVGRVGYIVLGVAGAALAATILYILVDPIQAGRLIGQLGSTWSGRAQLWQDAQALMHDYRFTGSGLGSTMMVYSTYYLLLHVGHTSHMHNLYLEIAVQQGLPGLIAFLAMVAGLAFLLIVTMAEATPGRRRLAAGAFAALIALLLHGLVDAGLYDSRLVPLVFLPLLIAWPIRARRRPDDPVSWGRLSFVSALVPVALMVISLLLPGSRAQFQANLGAVDQTIAELSVYSWPAYAIQDDLRQLDGVDLRLAEARYRASLTMDPNNVTAHQRLGQIALARGELDAAREHLQAALDSSPERRAVKLLLGEVRAIQGEPAQAAELWHGLDMDSGQFGVRRYWVQQMDNIQALQRYDAAQEEWKKSEAAP